MYKVMHTVFGKYVELDSFDTWKDALESAEKINNEGWQNVRILTPYGETVQVYGC